MHSNHDVGGWHPSATREMLFFRAKIIAKIRSFFADRNVLEVETPCLMPATVTDPNIASFETSYLGPGVSNPKTLYLQTSPEYAMKRLLAAGIGAIFQIGKAFRQGECGSLHQPEFTLLEWYQPEYEYQQLMDEVEALIRAVLPKQISQSFPTRLTYQELFLKYIDVNPLSTTKEELANLIKTTMQTDVVNLNSFDIDGLLDLLLTHKIMPKLANEAFLFVYDYPASQAALARLHPENKKVAQRFELFYNGIELANGYQELLDENEQRRRFQKNLVIRQVQGLPCLPIDEKLLAALASGLPDSAGVALGIDRLCMIAAGVDTINDVLTFPVAV